MFNKAWEAMGASNENDSSAVPTVELIVTTTAAWRSVRVDALHLRNVSLDHDVVMHTASSSIAVPLVSLPPKFKPLMPISEAPVRGVLP